jgi:hypothetical protein
MSALGFCVDEELIAQAEANGRNPDHVRRAVVERALFATVRERRLLEAAPWSC